MQFVIIFLVIPTVLSLKCYDLASKDIGAAPQEKTPVQNCRSNSSLCYKAILDIKADESRYTYGMYGCDENAEICNFAGVTSDNCRRNAGVNVCCCSDDLCNSSKSPYFLAIVFLVCMAHLE